MNAQTVPSALLSPPVQVPLWALMHHLLSVCLSVCRRNANELHLMYVLRFHFGPAVCLYLSYLEIWGWALCQCQVALLLIHAIQGTSGYIMVVRSGDDWPVCVVQDLYECLHVYKQTLENHPVTSKHSFIYRLPRNVKWVSLMFTWTGFAFPTCSRHVRDLAFITRGATGPKVGVSAKWSTKIWQSWNICRCTKKSQNCVLVQICSVM